MSARPPRTAQSLGVEFRDLEPVQYTTVRRHGEYCGRLIRTEPGGPVWADPQLQRHIGGSLTVDGTMEEARAAVLTRFQDQEAT